MTNVSNGKTLEEKIDALKALVDVIGQVAVDAGIDSLLKAQAIKIKAEQFAKFDPLRVELGKFIAAKIKNLVSDYPGLRIVLTDFDGPIGPVMAMDMVKDLGDGKSRRINLYGASTTSRKAVTGNACGPVKVIQEGRELSGKTFESTHALAGALGYDEKGKYGWMNVLRSHGFNRGEYYEYVKHIETETAKTEKTGTEGS